MATEPKVPHIYQAWVAAQTELAKLGISKDRRNEQQGFFFRGIDDTLRVVSPILAKNNIILLVNYTDFPDVERLTTKGGTLIYSKVHGKFTFVSAVDGSSVTASTYGVGMDSGDKGVAKAQTAALKSVILQGYLIPTESTEDADATSPDPSIPKPPEGFDQWYDDLVAVAEEGHEKLSAAWRDSSKPLKKYVVDYRKDHWAEVKARASAVTEKKKAAAK